MRCRTWHWCRRTPFAKRELYRSIFKNRNIFERKNNSHQHDVNINTATLLYIQLYPWWYCNECGDFGAVTKLQSFVCSPVLVIWRGVVNKKKGAWGVVLRVGLVAQRRCSDCGGVCGRALSTVLVCVAGAVWRGSDSALLRLQLGSPGEWGRWVWWK